MIWLLDPGHGGMVFGEYLTPGKRSPGVPPGVFEGKFNRRVCQLIQAEYETAVRNNPEKSEDTHRILTLTPGPINVPLLRKKGQGGQCRIEFINDICRRFKGEHVALISIHANASPRSGWSSANGHRVFVSKKASKNSRLLSRKVDWYMSQITELERRPIKAVNHHITTLTKCPAILVECAFMTNRADAVFLASRDGQIQIALANYAGMMGYENALGLTS
jgi:hypothetical protein